MFDVTNKKLTEYLGQDFPCTCGKTHSTLLSHVDISLEATENIPLYIQKKKYKYPIIICDKNTYDVLGKGLQTKLKENNIENKLHVISNCGNDELVPDESAVGSMITAIEKDNDLLICVGAGSINDLGKFVSSKLNLPYIIAATAPSMDGFASVGSALIIDGLKTTLDAKVPDGIFGDLKVLASAPKRLIVSGYGDIIGKYTCLLDWKIANIICGEYYCPQIVAMVEKSVNEISSLGSNADLTDINTVKIIMEALVLVGIAMSFVGNSRPASGSEHHLSHYWEMQFLKEGSPPVPHGIKVGVGTVISSFMYEKLLNSSIDWEKAKTVGEKFDHVKWEEEVKRLFGSASPGIISLDDKIKNNSVDKHKKRLENTCKKCNEVKQEISARLLPSDQVIKLLHRGGAPVSTSEISVDNQMIKDSILYAKEVRDRYTVLQLLWDLGLLEEFADYIVENMNIISEKE